MSGKQITTAINETAATAGCADGAGARISSEQTGQVPYLDSKAGPPNGLQHLQQRGRVAAATIRRPVSLDLCCRHPHAMPHNATCSTATAEGSLPSNSPPRGRRVICPAPLIYKSPNQNPDHTINARYCAKARRRKELARLLEFTTLRPCNKANLSRWTVAMHLVPVSPRPAMSG